MNPVDHIWQVALALAAIVGVVVMLGAAARRLQGVKKGSGRALKIVDSAYLGPKERLVLVKVADQHVLLAMNAQAIEKLAQYPAPPEFSDVLDQASPSPSAASSGGAV